MALEEFPIMSYPVTETNLDETPGRLTNPNFPARGDAFKQMADLDRELYGSRFNLLASHGRARDIVTEGSIRPYRAEDNVWHAPAYGMLFTVPDHLPGSNNVTSATGATAATAGGLVCRSLAQNARVEFGIRKVVLDGTGGFSSVGAWTIARSTHAAGSLTWQTANDVGTGAVDILLYPNLIAAGDTYELYTAFRVEGTYVATPAYLACFEIFEPNLINANP
jgi:hypothetical protein